MLRVLVRRAAAAAPRHTRFVAAAARAARPRAWHAAAAAAAAAAAGAVAYGTPVARSDAGQSKEGILEAPGRVNKRLPTYTWTELAQHKTPESRIWVAFRKGVYDITDFVEQHPGGEKILLAAGGSIEPFWKMYAEHLTERTVTILESLRVGNIVEPLPSGPQCDENDPYSGDPQRHPALVVRANKPFNAEAPAMLLGDRLVTSNDLHFVRNHLPVPCVDAASYSLEISGEGLARPIKLTLADLKTKYPAVTIPVTLQCAGNRRSHMKLPDLQTKGTPWGVGACSTAAWTGVPLRDILVANGSLLD